MSDISLATLSSTQFPHQKRAQSEKGKKFFKQCIDAGAGLSSWGDDQFGTTRIRSTRRNKIINYNLMNNVVDQKEMQRAVDPFRIQFQDMPISYRNYPLLNPNISLLVGEERKRTFTPLFLLSSSDAITAKVRNLQEKFDEFAIEKVTSGITDEQVIQREVQEFAKWAQFSYKDKRERMANQAIQYLMGKLKLKEQFSRGFEDLLIAAEEIFVIDIIGNEPVMRKGDPTNFYTLRGGQSYKIEDNDIIVEDGYLPPGEVVDRYYEYLKPEHIKKIEGGHSHQLGAKKSMFRQQLTNEPTRFDDIVESVGIGNLLSLNKKGSAYFGGSFDDEGNVRVTRVVWKGFKKIGVLEYFDELGNYQKDIVPESYEPDEERGEKVDWIWVTEWYEGTRIMDDIYVKTQPRDVQMRRMDNLSACHPGIVGTSFNIDGFESRSIVDLSKEYQYLYNVIMYRTELGIAKYLGKVGKINSAMIPSGWDMSKFLSYLYNMNLMIEDPFNEGQKGLAQGKLAGSMSQTGNSAEIGDAEFIIRHLEILDFIERRIDDITGITKQRKGAIDNRETVGGVERSVMQSSHITEKWFSLHDETKMRALECLLEAAKVAWSGKSFVKSYVLDDGTEAVLDFDGELFNEADYGGHLTSDTEDLNLMEQMKGLSRHFIQNGASMSMVAELLRTKDIGSLQNKIAMMEAEIQEQTQQAQEEEARMEQELKQAEREFEMMKLEIEAEQNELDRELDQYKIDQDNRTRIAVAQINAYRHQDDWDQDDSGRPDPMEIGEQALKEKQFFSEQFNKDSDREFKKKELKKKEELEKKKLELEEKKLKMQKELQKMKDEAAMKRERLKSKTALRNPTGAEAARGKTAPSKIKLGK